MPRARSSCWPAQNGSPPCTSSPPSGLSPHKPQHDTCTVHSLPLPDQVVPHIIIRQLRGPAQAPVRFQYLRQA